MTQHFLNSPAARSLSVKQVSRLSEQEIRDICVKARFAANDGKPFCPHCGPDPKVYGLKETPIRWKCSKCRRKFSLTSGTMLANRKKPLDDYLILIFCFVSGVKGLAALHGMRLAEFHPKSTFVLQHKFREVMGTEVHSLVLGGDGKIVEIDGTELGDAERETNKRPIKAPRRPWDKRIIGVIHERRGAVIAYVLEEEKELIQHVRDHVVRGTLVLADEADAWNVLRGRFRMKRVKHKKIFSKQPADTQGRISIRLNLFTRASNARSAAYTTG